MHLIQTKVIKKIALFYVTRIFAKLQLIEASVVQKVKQFFFCISSPLQIFFAARLLELEQQLLTKDNEVLALQESLRMAQQQKSDGAPTSETCQQTPEQLSDQSLPQYDDPPSGPDSVEDGQEECQEDETTLVAEDTSVLSANTESSPELLGHQSESPEESKVTSSDEMVASSDSEVAHSSWTLLEAVNQDGGQEWPSMLQDFGQLQLQSWETTSMETETSTVQAESSSVVIRETVQVHVTQQGSYSAPGEDDADGGGSPGQVFAQALAEALQKKYSELLAELQRLREAAADSQEKVKGLEEEMSSLSVAKEEADARASSLVEELRSAREQTEEISQRSSSTLEKHGIEMQLLEEQVDILNCGAKSREEKIQELQSEQEAARQAFSEQEGRMRMLSAQLEDRELLASELERRLQEMESSVLEYSQTSELNNDTLSRKESEITELQLLLSQKEQQVTELNDSMSAKLLQAEEEKFLVDSQVSKLREQIVELEKVRDEKAGGEESASGSGDDEVSRLQQEKAVMETQCATMKKKLQAALVQRKELMKKVAHLEAEAKAVKVQDETAAGASAAIDQEEEQRPRAQDFIDMEVKLAQLEQALAFKKEEVANLELKFNQQDQALNDALALNEKLREEAPSSQQSSEMAQLQAQVTSLEAECESLQKKVQEAQESRKETIRKAKEKDRHHRDQLKQQKEEFNELVERVEAQSAEREVLLTKLRELEEKVAAAAEKEGVPQQVAAQPVETLEKQTAGDWVQEDWEDFASAETQSVEPSQQTAEAPELPSTQMEEPLKDLREEIERLRMANTELEKQLQETQDSLSLKEKELVDFSEELQALRDKEKQIDALSEEVEELRQKQQNAESYVETLRTEMEAAAKEASADSTASIAGLQAEVEDFKQFLDQKNLEIAELGQQLGDQNSLMLSMQETVSEKDQLIFSLQEELRMEQEKTQRLEVEVPQKQQEEDKEGEAKVQQLQRKLQAALISRKEALKDNKSQKERLAASGELVAELQRRTEATEEELEKLKAERTRLIDEVDRMLLENQSLGSSCESLKLTMEALGTEKDTCRREAELARDEAARQCTEWEEKVQGMRDEYETLLKSYENVSDEAERVRRVLGAARQERQEVAAKVRTHEAARQEAERQAAEAQKEVETVKDKMRKFAKTKQQKISDLEEENERLREAQELTGAKREDTAVKAEVERLQSEVEEVRGELAAVIQEREALGQQVKELREKLAAETAEKDEDVAQSAVVVDEVITAQQSNTLTMTRAEPDLSRNEDEGEHVIREGALEDQTNAADDLQQTPPESTEETEEDPQVSREDKLTEVAAPDKTAELEAGLAAVKEEREELQRSLQESIERERSLIEEGTRKEAHFKELLSNLEAEKDNLEERLMNQLAQLNGSIAGYQQELADKREHLTHQQQQVEMLERERAEAEAEAQGASDRAARLEEDMRQAQRERAEAEAESGKQRELEQQLRSAQRVKEGSQSRARQLEELLREKQLEVRQLQKDSIQYQERISELGREMKALQLGRDELQSKLETSQLEASRTTEELRAVETQLASCRSGLEEAQAQARRTSEEKTALEESIQQREAALKEEAEQTLDSVRFRLGAELKDMELRLEDAYNERDKEEDAAAEAREAAERTEMRAQETQTRLDESLARLAAFSRCMSSLQDDRDRVLDETKQWEARFNGALQGKEAELREAESRAKELAEQLQRESALKEELQQTVGR